MSGQNRVRDRRGIGGIICIKIRAEIGIEQKEISNPSIHDLIVVDKKGSGDLVEDV